VALTGQAISLVPLAPLHAEQLFPLIDAELWSGMAARRPESPEALARLFAQRLEDPTALPFTVTGERKGELIGTTGLYEVNLEHGRAEAGGTFFGRAYWGAGANDASKLLLLGHAFETLGVSRVGFRVDTRNARSARALLRMGAQYEGTLRSHRVADESAATMGAGTTARIDTAVFSVLEQEWDSVRRRLLDRLALHEAA
jgi:RimJ/RimL family protein N-acetyltransferase